MKLVFYLHDGNIEEFNVQKDSVIIGRGKSCDVPVSFDGFSRQHAQIELIDGDIFVTDLGSTNGVFIDGNRIPPSQRTPMQSFFNLQMGSAQRVEVIDDSPAPNPPNTNSGESSESKLKIHPTRPTDENNKTKTLNTQLFKKPPTTKKSSVVVGKKAIGPNSIVAILLIGVCLFYFQTKSSEEMAEVDGVNQQSNNGPQVTLTETSFQTPALIESLAANKSCENDKLSWCQDANVLGTNQEGVVVEGKSLIVYYNMTLFLEEKHHTNFQSLPEQKRLEILLLRRVLFSTLPRSLIRQTTFDNFQAIGGSVQNNQMTLKIGLKMRRDADFKRLDKFTIIGLMDRIINAGEIEEIAKLTSLYEALPLN